VDEVEVPEGYEKSISEDGLTVTNTYIIEEPVVEEPDEPEDEDSIIVEDDEIPMGEIEGPMDVLPKTGEGSRQMFYLSGLLLILIGIVSKRRV
jgi:LPXTG-motif cell wall-anchored protein